VGVVVVVGTFRTVGATTVVVAVAEPVEQTQPPAMERIRAHSQKAVTALVVGALAELPGLEHIPVQVRTGMAAAAAVDGAPLAVAPAVPLAAPQSSATPTSPGSTPALATGASHDYSFLGNPHTGAADPGRAPAV